VRLARALLLLLLIFPGRPVPICQNGWPALTDPSQTAIYQIGDTVNVRLAPGAAGELLADFGRWFDKNIRDLDGGILDDWGWAFRDVRGGTDISNHAGYAIDLNATRWALGSDASVYLTQAEIDRIHVKLRDYGGVIRWGQDYDGRTDPMHYEIIGTVAQVNAVWQAMKGGGIKPAAVVTAGRPTIAKGATGQAVRDLQAKLLKSYPAYRHAHGTLVVDGDFGKITDAWVREFQSRSGLAVDGIVGPKTWAKLGL
jgi:hypothetical protein